MDIKHFKFLLHELKDIPQKDKYFKKLLKEKVDNLIYILNLEENKKQNNEKNFKLDSGFKYISSKFNQLETQKETKYFNQNTKEELILIQKLI